MFVIFIYTDITNRSCSYVYDLSLYKISHVSSGLLVLATSPKFEDNFAQLKFIILHYEKKKT
jgi:hypothetical protein